MLHHFIRIFLVAIMIAAFASWRILKKKDAPVNSVGNNVNELPRPVGYVNDFEGIFSAEGGEELTKIIVDYKCNNTFLCV